jgi:hypothetical protein
MCEYQQQECDAQPGNDGQVARVHGEHVVHARAPHLPPTTPQETAASMRQTLFENEGNNYIITKRRNKFTKNDERKSSTKHIETKI